MSIDEDMNLLVDRRLNGPNVRAASVIVAPPCRCVIHVDVLRQLKPVAMFPALNVLGDPHSCPVSPELRKWLEEDTVAINFVVDFFSELLSPSAVIVTPVTMVNIDTMRICGLDELSSIRELISSHDSVSMASNKTIGVFH